MFQKSPNSPLAVQPTPHLPVTNHYVFVDFENVCAFEPSVLGQANVSLVLLIGPGRKQLDLELVENMLLHAGSVQLVRLRSGAKNALDFTLAYYLGQSVLVDPNGSFHVVSRDKGYDPLIEHLQSKQIHACRHDDFSTLCFPNPAHPPNGHPSAKGLKAKVEAATKAEPELTDALDARVWNRLMTSTARPKTRIRLVSFIRGQLGNGTTPAQAEHVVESLSATGRIRIDATGAVNYGAKPI